MNLIKKEKGFSLLELMLVLAIVSMAFVGFLTFTKRLSDQMTAEAAGQQFADISKALGDYISRESSNLLSCIPVGTNITSVPLAVLTTATGTTTVGACTLNNRQYLPTTVSSTNLFKTGYNIGIENNASGSLGGIVLSSAPIVDPGSPGVVRYDWIGMAMKKAGAQSGMTFSATGANTLVGLGAGWQLTSATDYSTINKVGLFGVRTGYQGTYDDIYLRLDGAYPMRGNLNMGNFSVNNATDLNFNGWLNGNNALLNNLASGYINNSGNIQTNTLTATTSMATGGRQSNPMPAAWTGDYIHTWNIYAENEVGVGTGGALNAYMQANGLVGAQDVMLTTGSFGKDGRTPYTGYLSDRLPQYVSRGAVVVNDGTVVPKPNCTSAGGSTFARIIVIPQVQNVYGNYNVTLTITNTAPNTYNFLLSRTPYTSEQIQVYAVDNGASWTVHLTSAGAQAFGATPGYLGLAETFCDFG
jgi:prepilin-type N-terminal cleavage/methylation domain-containing protein